jgi:hypothetical protein
MINVSIFLLAEKGRQYVNEAKKTSLFSCYRHNVFINNGNLTNAGDIPCISGDNNSLANAKYLYKVTVGQNGYVDFQGATDKAIQSAIDYISKYGGGTVQILPGTYRLSNAIYLKSHIQLIGSGATNNLY